MDEIHKLKVEHWPVAKILPYAQNARTHSTDQIKQISASIEEFGFVNPCLVDANGVLIAGHGRCLAAAALKMGTVPVIVLGHLTETQARALRLADNQIALNAGWNEELLRIELDELIKLDLDLKLLGFDDFKFINADYPVDPDDVPEPPAEPVSRPGDLWLLGKHRLLCGDATSEADVAKLLGGAKPHLMVTDPPYGVDYDPDWRNRADRANGKPYGAREGP